MEIIVRSGPLPVAVPGLVRNRAIRQGPWASEQRNHVLPFIVILSTG